MFDIHPIQYYCIIEEVMDSTQKCIELTFIKKFGILYV